ncbi:MAG: MarR family transcriptional regulator [Anaerolineae bacterium]|nr:MarR family transcriptional regulator [Anaerolineae bacterium]
MSNLMIPVSQNTDELTRSILTDQIGFNLRLAYFITSQLFNDAFTDLYITPIQFAILEVVAANPDLTQRQIAELVGTAPSVLVDPLRKLERRGLIQRERAEQDRRQHNVRLTEDGIAFQEQARVRIGQVEANLTDDLDDAEQMTLLTLLQKLVASHENT